MQDLEAYHTAAMVTSPRGEAAREAREHHHTMLCALAELAEQLALYVAAKAEAEAILADPATEDGTDDVE